MAQWAGRTTFLCDSHVKITENVKAWWSLLQSLFKEKWNLTSSQFPVSWQGRTLFSPVTICVWTALWVASAFTLDSNKEQHSAMGSSLRQCMHRFLRGDQWPCFLISWFQLQINPLSLPSHLHLSYLNFLQSPFFHLTCYSFICLFSYHPSTPWKVTAGQKPLTPLLIPGLWTCRMHWWIKVDRGEELPGVLNFLLTSLN